MKPTEIIHVAISSERDGTWIVRWRCNMPNGGISVLWQHAGLTSLWEAGQVAAALDVEDWQSWLA